MLRPDLPLIHDEEGPAVPLGLPLVIDAHVHVFPHEIFAAVRNWFEEHAWRVRYPLKTSEVFEYLLARGVAHVVALQYAHKPGIAAALNRYLAGKCRDYPGRVSGMATVFPGEPGAGRILQEAFDSGLCGLKLHAHVQCFDMNAAEMEPLYDCCQSNGKPVVMHVGRQPRSEAYRCDLDRICRAEKLERVLKDFPRLRVCVPHLGFDELCAYRELIEKYDTLWLDTTMVLTDYFPLRQEVDLNRYRLDRVMYGSDFPNIPYAWDRELKRLLGSGLSDAGLEWVAGKSACGFFGLEFLRG